MAEETENGTKASPVAPAISFRVAGVNRTSYESEYENDYSQNFVDTGDRPQNFMRDIHLANVLNYHPLERALVEKKNEVIEDKACPAMSFNCNLKECHLSENLFGTRFDVILVDPPLEDYARRAPFSPAHTNNTWTHQQIQSLRIQHIADTPCFIFLWVGSSEGIEPGLNCFRQWGFHKIEDICWVKTNKRRRKHAFALVDDGSTLLQRSTEYCLVGINKKIDRDSESGIVHSNIDTDIIVSEEPYEYGSTKKPEELYGIIERLVQGGRRIELFGEDHNIRRGWLTVGDKISTPNFNQQAYVDHFGTSNVVGSTEEIENLRIWCRRISPEQYQTQLKNSIERLQQQHPEPQLEMYQLSHKDPTKWHYEYQLWHHWYQWWLWHHTLLTKHYYLQSPSFLKHQFIALGRYDLPLYEKWWIQWNQLQRHLLKQPLQISPQLQQQPQPERPPPLHPQLTLLRELHNIVQYSEIQNPSWWNHWHMGWIRLHRRFHPPPQQSQSIFL